MIGKTHTLKRMTAALALALIPAVMVASARGARGARLLPSSSSSTGSTARICCTKDRSRRRPRFARPGMQPTSARTTPPCRRSGDSAARARAEISPPGCPHSSPNTVVAAPGRSSTAAGRSPICAERAHSRASRSAAAPTPRSRSRFAAPGTASCTRRRRANHHDRKRSRAQTPAPEGRIPTAHCDLSRRRSKSDLVHVRRRRPTQTVRAVGVEERSDKRWKPHRRPARPAPEAHTSPPTARRRQRSIRKQLFPGETPPPPIEARDVKVARRPNPPRHL